MTTPRLPLAEIELIVFTRIALGIGLGLVLADRMPDSSRQALGWTLAALGLASTIPLRIDVLRRSQVSHPLAKEAFP